MKSSVRLLNHIIKIMNLQQSLIIRDEQWNQSYEAYNFNINGYVFKSRLAKKTTKKKGYFLSLWEKDKTKKNRAFDYESFPGKLIVHVMDDSQVGQFIFPKHVLFHKGILRNHASKGKWLSSVSYMGERFKSCRSQDTRVAKTILYRYVSNN